MNLKKMIFVNAILTFALCFLTHFLYEWLPNPVFSIIFPVNESIWEHMKMIYTTILLYGILEYFILKYFKIPRNNFLFSILIKAVAAIPIYLIIYLPIYHMIGENMAVSIILLFLVILAVNYFGYKLQERNEIKSQNAFSIVMIILGFIIFGFLTYRPMKTELFFDPQNEVYGIDDYLIKK